MSEILSIADMARASPKVREVPRADICSTAKPKLFDHLVGAQHDRRWHFEAERPCSLQIDSELELGWLLHRQIGGLGTFKKTINIESRLAKLMFYVRSV